MSRSIELGNLNYSKTGKNYSFDKYLLPTVLFYRKII